METVLDSLAIQKLLPHRYPFLLVDRIVELVPRQRIVGIKQVSINESFFQGHFPSAPVMPGVLVVEALAQVGAVLALREIEDRDQKLVLFTGIKEARFRRPVVPGDTLKQESFFQFLALMFHPLATTFSRVVDLWLPPLIGRTFIQALS